MTAPVRAVSIDAAGTLLLPSRPVAAVYAEAARAFGVDTSADAIASRLPTAMRELRDLRRGDPSWRGYWAAIVARATGCDAPELVDRLFDHYARGSAWRVAPDAAPALETLRAGGLRLAVLSNWDTRLPGTLAQLGVSGLFDQLIVSAHTPWEKPDPRIFALACERLGVDADALVHVGDDDEDDLAGARAAGARAVHIVRDVGGFARLVTTIARLSRG